MSNYELRHQKKRIRLRNLESGLLSALEDGSDQAQVHEAAENVRQATIRVVRAERAQIPPNGLHSKRLSMIDSKISEWESKKVEEIVELYVKKLAE